MRFEESDLKNVITFLKTINSPESVIANKEKLSNMSEWFILFIEEYTRTREYNKLLIEGLSEIPSQMQHLEGVKINQDQFAEIFLGLRLNVSDMYARAQCKSLLF